MRRDVIRFVVNKRCAFCGGGESEKTKQKKTENFIHKSLFFHEIVLLFRL